MQEILKGDGFLISDIKIEYIDGLGLRLTPVPKQELKPNFFDLNMGQIEQLYPILTQILLLNENNNK